MSDQVLILAIETSCDETAAAVVRDGREICSTVVASQADLHARYGGVFPEMASRQHIKTIQAVVQDALDGAGMTLAGIDALAVTRGPGLPGSLVVGVNLAKGLALASGLPLIGVNHLEGHIYAAWLAGYDREPQFPLVALVVSGGHTELVLMKDHLVYESLGSTLDDAAGEAFDKTARLLDLGYPGGPRIQKAAEDGNPQRFDFPRAWLEGSLDFSFSGLKTAVLRQVQSLQEAPGGIPVSDIAAGFQEAVIDVLVTKTLRAAQEREARSIVVAGGVSANKPLRQAFESAAEIPVFIPPLALCTDNAAMIAAAGHYRFQAGQRDGLNFDIRPNWPLSELETAAFRLEA